MSKCFKGWLKSFKKPDYEKDREWRVESEWFQKLKPDTNVDCNLVLSYARGNYEETRKIYDRIDDKADSLRRFGAVLVGALFALQKSSNIPVDWFTVVPYVFFLASVVIAMLARQPVKSPSPTKARELLDRALSKSLSENQIAATMAASYHTAVVGTTSANFWKATLLGRANWVFILGLVSLPVFLILSYFLSAQC